MLTLKRAIDLKKAGLEWRPKNHDFFGIPDSGLEERIFVLTDIMAYLDTYQKWPVVTFYGSAEWAQDYVLPSEAVWLPTEGQLRREIENRIKFDGQARLTLTASEGSYRCVLVLEGSSTAIEAQSASGAYAETLLNLLSRRSRAEMLD